MAGLERAKAHGCSCLHPQRHSRGGSSDQRFRTVGRQLAGSYRPLRKCSSTLQEELMTTTRTPGITVLADGRRFIDKRYLGVRIGLRVGAVTQEQAEERLDIEIARVQCDLARKAHARPTFTDCAARYVAQSRGKRSIDVIKWHVTLLQSYIGKLEPRQIHDATLESFVSDRLAAGACATTINRSLEVVRTILNRAAR